jgi:hypothetical protein
MYNFEDDNPLNNTEGFSSSYYKELLDNSENRNAAYVKAMTTPEAVDADYEEIKEEPVPSKEDDPFMEEESDAKKLLNKGTSKGLTAVSKILDPKNISADTQTDVVATFRSLFNDLNTTYGLDIKFDFNSFTNTLNYIIKPKNKAAIELYLSEAYSRVRSSLYMLYLNAIATLSTQILDPRFITSNSMSYTDKLLLMRELFNYIQSLDQIYENVNVKDSDIQLRKLAESNESDDEFNSDEVQKFLTALTNSIKSKDQGKT